MEFAFCVGEGAYKTLSLGLSFGLGPSAAGLGVGLCKKYIQNKLRFAFETQRNIHPGYLDRGGRAAVRPGGRMDF